MPKKIYMSKEDNKGLFLEFKKRYKIKKYLIDILQQAPHTCKELTLKALTLVASEKQIKLIYSEKDIEGLEGYDLVCNVKKSAASSFYKKINNSLNDGVRRTLLTESHPLFESRKIEDESYYMVYGGFGKRIQISNLLNPTSEADFDLNFSNFKFMK